MGDVQEFAQQLKQARQGHRYWTELSKQEYAEGLRRVMGDMKQCELAELLPGKSGSGVSESHVSRLLAGRYNHTISKMNEVAHELDAAVHICVAQRGSLVRWTIDASGEKQEVARNQVDLSERVKDSPVGESKVTYIDRYRAEAATAPISADSSEIGALSRTEVATGVDLEARTGGTRGYEGC